MDQEKAFDRIPRKVGNEEERKTIIFGRSMMSLYEGMKTMVRMDSELSEEFEVKVRMHQGSMLSPFLSAVVEDVVTEFAKEGALSELLYADFAQISETIERLKNKFIKWKEAFENKGVKASLWKTKGKVDP